MEFQAIEKTFLAAWQVITFVNYNMRKSASFDADLLISQLFWSAFVQKLFISASSITIVRRNQHRDRQIAQKTDKCAACAQVKPCRGFIERAVAIMIRFFSLTLK
jgi:hypothetical protein